MKKMFDRLRALNTSLTGGVFFGAFFFFGARFCFVGGWCRLELCHFCNLWQEKTRIAEEIRALQPNTPFRASGFATQHSF